LELGTSRFPVFDYYLCFRKIHGGTTACKQCQSYPSVKLTCVAVLQAQRSQTNFSFYFCDNSINTYIGPEIQENIKLLITT